MAKSSKTKTDAPQPEVQPAPINPRKRWAIFGIILAGLLVLSSLVAGTFFYYSNRALPGVTVAGIAVGNKTKEEIAAIIADQKALMKVTFTLDGKAQTADIPELGVVIDEEKSVQNVLDQRRDIYSLDLWQTRNVALSYVADLGVFKEYIKQQFPSVVVDAQDAQLVFNQGSKKFDINPGATGKGFDLLSFAQAVEALVAKPQAITLPVSTSAVQPLIRPESLTALQEKVNKQVGGSVRFNYQGRHIYSADPQDIAGWANFTPDPVKGSVDVAFDPAKIRQFLTQKVGPIIAAPAKDRKVINDTSTGQEIVIQQGQIGRQLDDVDGMVAKVLDALNKNTPLETELAITTAPFKTINLAGTGRWIEVDLSEQRTTLWLGTTKVASYLISSGVSWAPTVQGEFNMHYKTASQTMTGGSRASGDYYYLPGVTWVSYFYKDYSFHTAYWHNNFGHPMSHGCVNMRYDDAKALYDFAPLGTKVIVHA